MLQLLCANDLMFAVQNAEKKVGDRSWPTAEVSPLKSSKGTCVFVIALR